MLASKVLGRRSYGTDINHIAILISNFKLLNLESYNFNNLYNFISNFENSYLGLIDNVKLFSYVSIEHWFCKDAIKVLSLIKNLIEKIYDEKEKIFCKLIMSSILNSVSNQESDTRYAAVSKAKLNIEYIANMFIKKFYSSLTLFKEFIDSHNNVEGNFAYLHDSKKCTDVIPSNSVDLILTSPPYPNTYDYYLYPQHIIN